MSQNDLVLSHSASSSSASSSLPSGVVEGDASLTMTSSTPAGDNSLVATLTGLHGLADKMFLNALNCQGKVFDRWFDCCFSWWFDWYDVYWLFDWLSNLTGWLP